MKYRIAKKVLRCFRLSDGRISLARYRRGTIEAAKDTSASRNRRRFLGSTEAKGNDAEVVMLEEEDHQLEVEEMRRAEMLRAEFDEQCEGMA